MPHPHVHSPTYAPPVLRAPSPASSLGTTYAPDATSFSDTEAELSQTAFEKKWEDKLRLGREFAREWNGDLGEGEDEGDEDGYEGWNGMRAVRDREREGWGRDPLINTGETQRTPAEDKCNVLSFPCLPSLTHHPTQTSTNESSVPCATESISSNKTKYLNKPSLRVVAPQKPHYRSTTNHRQTTSTRLCGV